MARMTPAERVALSERLGEEGLAEYMASAGDPRAASMNVLEEVSRVLESIGATRMLLE